MLRHRIDNDRRSLSIEHPNRWVDVPLPAMVINRFEHHHVLLLAFVAAEGRDAPLLGAYGWDGVPRWARARWQTPLSLSPDRCLYWARGPDRTLYARRVALIDDVLGVFEGRR